MISAVARPLRDAPVEELLQAGVWEFVPESPQHDETWVQPVLALPVSSLAGRVAALSVRLNNATLRPAILGGIDLNNPTHTQHFLALTFISDSDGWFDLARYHDYDYESRGPRALAEFLRLPLSAIFPISYDLSQVARGTAASLVGQISAEPDKRLSRAELIALAVPRRGAAL